MPAGEAFTQRQQDDIVRAIRYARSTADLSVSVFVGPLDADPRRHARRLLAATGPDAADAVLVAVDPGGRHLEIVTGPVVRRRLDDRACGLAALTMTTAFQAGDLAGGISGGLTTLAEHARRPQSLHRDGI